jgi:hypothetical protein
MNHKISADRDSIRRTSMSTDNWSFTRLYDEAKYAAKRKRIRSLARPGILLRNGEPVSLILRSCLSENHEWHLNQEGDQFNVECCHCGAKMKVWKRLPISLGYVLAAAARLDYGKNSEVMIRAAAGSLNLSRRRSYDLTITFLKLLRIKNGGACGDELIGSKTLRTLVHLAMWPDQLRKMARSTMRPYKFVIDAVMMLDVQLS